MIIIIINYYKRIHPDFLAFPEGAAVSGLLSVGAGPLPSFLLLTSRTSSLKHSSTFTWSLADVSKKGQLLSWAARRSPSDFCTTRWSSRSHLFPTCPKKWKSHSLSLWNLISVICAYQYHRDIRGILYPLNLFAKIIHLMETLLVCYTVNHQEALPLTEPTILHGAFWEHIRKIVSGYQGGRARNLLYSSRTHVTNSICNTFTCYVTLICQL